MKATPLPPAESLKFEAALAELEVIVNRMEDGKLPLEESLAAYRRGAELLRRCQDLLGDAEQQLQVLEKGVLTAPGAQLRDLLPAINGSAD